MYGVRGRVKLYYYINRTSPLINTAENLNCATTFGGAPVSNYKKKNRSIVYALIYWSDTERQT